MADEKNPHDPVSDGLFENALTFSQSSMKWATKVALNAYRKFGYVAATLLPITLTIGGPASISTQQPIRKPDEHLASQAQSGPPQEVRHVFESTSAVTASFKIPFEALAAISMSAEVVKQNPTNNT